MAKSCISSGFCDYRPYGELLGLTWDCVDVSEEAIAENRAYIFINKQVERVSRNAVDELYAKEDNPDFFLPRGKTTKPSGY